MPSLVADNERRPKLRVLNGGQTALTETPLEVDIRGARRDLARLLRAMQAAGHSVTRWQSDVVSRLAHFDSVTARYLIDGSGEHAAVEAAVRGLLTIEAWVDDGLTTLQRAEVRAFELIIRIEDHELHEPLLRPHHAPEEHSPSVREQAPDALRSLRAGLRVLEDSDLFDLGRRLGVAPFEALDSDARRVHFTDLIVETLHDDHLLAILLATLESTAQRVLLELVRGEIHESELEELATPSPLALVVGGTPLHGHNPVDRLRACGLVFGSMTKPGKAWVPVELQPRISGVL
ncbi:MAG: hypothetical protein KUG77_19270, partial [Nannocystaceae bacterium]|nr:hypothetical protein [Nannocystaceae bacterium]